MLSKQIYLAGMARLSGFFTKEDTSEQYLRDYYSALEKYNISDEQFNRTVVHLISFHNSPKFPIPSVFLQAVRDSAPKPDYSPKERQIEPTYAPCPPEVKKMMERFKTDKPRVKKESLEKMVEAAAELDGGL